MMGVGVERIRRTDVGRARGALAEEGRKRRKMLSGDDTLNVTQQTQYMISCVVGVFATMAAAFWSTPGTAAARGVFRASLLFLPIWMGALLLHRIPQEPEDQLTWEGLAQSLRDLWERHGWFLFHPLGYRGPTVAQDEALPDLGVACPVKLLQGAAAHPPFPLLPVPLPLVLPPPSPEQMALQAESAQSRPRDISN